VPDRREPCFAVDGQDLKALVRAGLTWLRHHQEDINVLNVFPVPDGDTGTNMVLTMQSAWEEVANTEAIDIAEVAHLLAHGALMGARGNSGVILSQIWRGLARSLDEKEVLTAQELGAALQEAARTAYKGVIHPVEGTILTVIREAAEEAARAAAETDDQIELLERVVSEAGRSVDRTPTLLPVLAEAGVVDAGGRGLQVILEGMLRYAHGESVPEEAYLVETARPSAAPTAVEAEYGYDVQFILMGQDLDVSMIRQHIDDMGESALVVGEPGAVKVHVHVVDPGLPLSYAVKLGSLRDVVVEDMQAQYQEFVGVRKQPTVPAPSRTSTEIGVVAVAAGEGIARVFASLGAANVIRGGQTMNPSTEEILQAVESLPNERVILLPNNKNIILAAEQARDLSDKQVAVVPTRTIPQGVAALLALNYQAGLEENATEMAEAAQEVHSGEVTAATRDVTLNGLTVREGQIIGIHNEELVVAGETIKEVLEALLERMGVDNLEIVTLYYGSAVPGNEARQLAAYLHETHPEQEFEVIEGGQPHYFYIVSAE